jgi:ABC-type sulfate transport system permease component
VTSHILLRLALRSTAVGYVLLLIFLPLAALAQQSVAAGWERFLQDISAPQAAAAFWLTVQTAAVTTAIGGGVGAV